MVEAALAALAPLSGARSAGAGAVTSYVSLPARLELETASIEARVGAAPAVHGLPQLAAGVAGEGPGREAAPPGLNPRPGRP